MAPTMKVLLCAAFALSVPASAAGLSPVQKVLSLIDDMVGKVQGELDTAVKEFTEFSKYCDDEVTEKGYAMKTSEKEISSLEASITDSKASIEALTAKISDLSTKISSTQEELDEAVALRTKEAADFKVEEKQLLGDVEAISAAMKAMSMAQLTPDAKKGLEAIQAGLKQVAVSSFITHAKASKVEAFLQARADAEDGLDAGSGSDGVLDKVLQMAEDSLSGAREKEQKASFSHAKLKMGLESEIKSLNKELGEATHGKQVSIEKLAQATKDLAVEKKGHAEDTSYVGDLKREYNSKAEDFEVEAKDAAAELKALAAAKAILAKKFGFLLQVRARTTSTSASRLQGDDKRARALREIQQLGRRLHSTALVALAYRAAADPFAKVRGMIEDMLVKLQQEAAEAADTEAFCNEEKGKSEKSKAEKEAAIAKVSARMEKAESAVSELTEQVAALSKELAENDAAMTEATKLRNEEKASFLAAEKELSESIDACGAAIQVLREYYEGASLVQTSARSKTMVASKAKAKAKSGGGILDVLEYAVSDFEKQLSDKRAAESVSTDKYDKMSQDSKMLKATKEIEVKSKESEVKRLKTAILEASEDKESTSTELEAVVAYLDELKPKCEVAVPSYAEVKAKREQELEGLKSALKILE